MSKTDLLHHWKLNFDFVSSELNPNKQIDRVYVDFVYNTLLDFWGIDFFKVNMLDAIHENKVHFILTFLSKADQSSFYYLMEVSSLLDYAKDSKPDFYKKLVSVRYQSNKIRDVLFELYIDFTFKRNNIPYFSNILHENQWKDGYCILKNNVYLVECKKKYSIISRELQLHSYLSSEIIKIVKNVKYGFEGIGILKLKRDNCTKEILSPLLKEFKNYLVNRTEYNPSYSTENENLSLQIKELNNPNRIELENRLIPYSIYFTIQNLNRLNLSGLNEFRIQIHFQLFSDRKKIAEKLINSISKARKQHNNDKNNVRIYFVDNEFINDFTAPLLGSNKYYEQELQNYLNSKKTDDIVALLYRSFIAKKPSVIASVICRKELNEIKSELENLEFITINLNILRQ